MCIDWKGSCSASSMVRCSRFDWNYLARTRAPEYKYCVHYTNLLRRPYRRSCAKTIGRLITPSAPPQTDPTPQATAQSETFATRSEGIHPVYVAVVFANRLVAAQVHHERRATTAPSLALRARCLHPLSCKNPGRPRCLVLALFYARAWLETSWS
jgi:hypothetical protein